MKSLLARSLQYYLLPGKPPTGFPHAQLHNDVYRFWRDFWTAVLKTNGAHEKLNEAEFRRLDRLSVVVHQGKIVALLGQCFFDISFASERDHSYFKRLYNEAFLQALEKRGAKQIMTEEFVTVDSAWRKSEIGVSLASVVIGLGLKLAQAEKVQAVIGVAREDVAVDKRVMDQGALALQRGLDIYKTPCSLIAFFPETIRPAEDEKVNELVNHLWKNRIDTTVETPVREVKKRAA